MAESYDVIIIGSGAGGGTLARHLAPSGKRILLLERGDWLPREPENWSTLDVFVDGRYVSTDNWYSVQHKSFFQPQVHYFVGGATKLYGAALYRMREKDFGELQHHDGVSPAWPISYQDMEPYYTAAEDLYQVHGARGEDPTEPPSSAPYPYPAVSHEPRIQQLSDDLEKQGYHPFHAPCGILVDEANLPYSTCVKCGECDGFPCPLHAKSDAEVIGVRPALEHDNVTLLRNAQAVKLDANPAGTTVTGVVVEHDGETERYAGNIVVVACGAANSAKLLLASASDRHPNGLANGSDQVGRNFMYHDCQAVLAISKEPNPTVFQKTLGINDFYFSGPDFDYPMGNIQMIGKSQAEMFRGEKPLETKFAPSWALRDVAEHAVDFWLSTEDLPQPDQPGDARPRRRRPHLLHAEQPDRRQAAIRPAQVDARLARHARGPPDPPVHVHEDRDPDRRLRASGRDRPLRLRPGHVGAQRRLPRARGRQPLRGRHQHLPEHQRGEPGPDGDGERHPGRRPHPGPAGLDAAKGERGATPGCCTSAW